jgi:hypothetical protein
MPKQFEIFRLSEGTLVAVIQSALLDAMRKRAESSRDQRRG